MTDAVAVRSRQQTRIGLVGVAVLLTVVVLGLSWAKWVPYAQKAVSLGHTRTWAGTSLLGSAGEQGGPPTLAGAWQFTLDYFALVWKAAVVALVVAALLDSVVPRRWLIGVMARRTRVGQSAAAGVLALPGMMCTCCAAPVAVGLRRRGAPTAASVAYWMANPLLNPAVLVFLFLVLPWQYAVVRVVLGGVLVLGVSALVARLAEDRPGNSGDPTCDPTSDRTREPEHWQELPARFARSLLRFGLVLVPEYAIAVFLTGAVSGWLSDFPGVAARLGTLAVLGVALVGAVLVIPTGGEIPVVAAVAASGAGLGVTGALLIALPALSLPSVVMVARALSWRVTGFVVAAVVAAAVLAGGLLAVLG